MKETTIELLATPYKGDEAIAAAISDSMATWLKFVFTDSKPNGNNQGIREEEFDRLITSGLHKPFKKILGVAGGHEGAVPIGSIALMEKEGSKVVGVAAIWDTEYPEEAAWLKEAYASNEPLNTSWEIMYADFEMDEDGVEWLQGCTTKAVTCVEHPAYEGRTPILAVAAKWSKPYLKDLPNDAFLYVEGGKRLFPYKDSDGDIDTDRLKCAKEEIPHEKALSEATKINLLAAAENLLKGQGESRMDNEKLQEDLKESLADVAKLNEEKKSLQEGLADANEALKDLVDVNKELEELRTYKKEAEDTKARTSLIKDRMTLFSEAGFEITEEDFMANADQWLGFDDSAFEFVLQTMLKSKQTADDANDPDSANASLVPGLPADKAAKSALKKVRELFDEMNKKDEDE